MIELEPRPGSEQPRGVEGWFLVWLGPGARPVVLWRGLLSTQWRSGAMVLHHVVAWAGPLGELELPVLPADEEWN